jgi:hypothetical protein
MSSWLGGMRRARQRRWNRSVFICDNHRSLALPAPVRKITAARPGAPRLNRQHLTDQNIQCTPLLLPNEWYLCYLASIQSSFPHILTASPEAPAVNSPLLPDTFASCDFGLGAGSPRLLEHKPRLAHSHCEKSSRARAPAVSTSTGSPPVSGTPAPCHSLQHAIPPTRSAWIPRAPPQAPPTRRE